MDSKMAWLASAVTAVVVSAGAVLVTAGPAAAAPAGLQGEFLVQGLCGGLV